MKAEGGKSGVGRRETEKKEGKRGKAEGGKSGDERPKTEDKIYNLTFLLLLTFYFLLLTFYFLLLTSYFVFIHFQNPLYKNIPAIFLFFFLHIFNKDPSPVIPKKIHNGS